MLDLFEDAEVISVYTRANALEDGVLVDVSKMAAEAGFRWPTAITESLHNRLEPNEREKFLGQSYEGRLWDVLWMAFVNACRNQNTDRISFQVIIYEADKGRPRQNYVNLLATAGPGDNAEPVLTIGFPEDF